MKITLNTKKSFVWFLCEPGFLENPYPVLNLSNTVGDFPDELPKWAEDQVMLGISMGTIFADFPKKEVQLKEIKTEITELVNAPSVAKKAKKKSTKKVNK